MSLSRRGLLAGGSAALLATSAAGCDALSTDPAGRGEQTGERERNAREAPELARRVKQGELETLRKRLPKDPMVVKPVDRAGTYGGEWHSALLGTANAAYIYCLTGYENLVRWSRQWTGATGTQEIEPNVAASFETRKGGREFTFRLRKGMRWSDGEPFTADDIAFAVEDVLLNKDLSPVPPGFLTTIDGKPVTIDKPDDHTITFTFAAPVGLFLQHLATPAAHVLTHYAKHYLKQFHKLYNPDVGTLVKESGQDDWMSLLQAKGGAWNWGQNPDQPSLAGWKLVSPFGQGTRVVVDRNPYYWKVDSGRRQLPYIDRVAFEVVNNSQVLLLRASHGDIDLEAGPDTRFTTLQNKPVLARNRKKAGYRFLDVRPSFMNIMVICLNLANEDPVHREIFGKLDFRVGLSHAINRPEMIKATLQGQAKPYQAAPLPDSPFYDEELATQYLDYDVEKANRHLDRAGYTRRSADGVRLGPDGKPIVITMDVVPDFQPEWTDMLGHVKRYWHAVGVGLNLKTEDRSLFGERTAANRHDATVWSGAGGRAVLLDARYYFPFNGGSYFGLPWMDWYNSGGESGEKPPAAARRQMKLFDQLRETVDSDRQHAIMTEVLGIAKSQFYAIGIARETQKYFIRSDKFRNVPNTLTKSWSYPTPGPTETSQYFIER